MQFQYTSIQSEMTGTKKKSLCNFVSIVVPQKKKYSGERGAIR